MSRKVKINKRCIFWVILKTNHNIIIIKKFRKMLNKILWIILKLEYFLKPHIFINKVLKVIIIKVKTIKLKNFKIIFKF